MSDLQLSWQQLVSRLPHLESDVVVKRACDIKVSVFRSTFGAAAVLNMAAASMAVPAPDEPAQSLHHSYAKPLQHLSPSCLLVGWGTAAGNVAEAAGAAQHNPSCCQQPEGPVAEHGQLISGCSRV